MTRPLVVYGTALAYNPRDPIEMGNSRQIRAIVATRTKKEAAMAFGITIGDFNNYASVTGNQRELDIALSKPGQVFANQLDFRNGPYVEITREAHVPKSRSKRKSYLLKPPSPVFTNDELETILERFAMANDPVGQAVADKAKRIIAYREDV